MNQNMIEWCESLPSIEGRETWQIGGMTVLRPTADETVDKLHESGKPTRFIQNDIQDMWWEELKDAGILTRVPMDVSKKGHDIGHRDVYADATLRPTDNFPYIRVILHPFHLYQDESYVRDVMRHEISHIKARAKQSKKIRGALGL